jgi:hypothetical protein
MTKLTPPTVDLRVIRRDPPLRAFKTTFHRLASSGNAHHHFQANLLRCKGHGRSRLCGGADAAWPRQPAASHGLQRIGRGGPAPSMPTRSLRVTARTAPRSALLRRGYQGGVNLAEAASPAMHSSRPRLFRGNTQPGSQARGHNGPAAPVRPPAVPVLDGIEQTPQRGCSLPSGLGG